MRMVETKERAAWARACEVVAAVANFGYSRPKRTVRGADLNPYRKEPLAAGKPSKIPAKLFIEYLAIALGAKKK
jgi:hypothetical protein